MVKEGKETSSSDYASIPEAFHFEDLFYKFISSYKTLLKTNHPTLINFPCPLTLSQLICQCPLQIQQQLDSTHHVNELSTSKSPSRSSTSFSSNHVDNATIPHNAPTNLPPHYFPAEPPNKSFELVLKGFQGAVVSNRFLFCQSLHIAECVVVSEPILDPAYASEATRRVPSRDSKLGAASGTTLCQELATGLVHALYTSPNSWKEYIVDILCGVGEMTKIVKWPIQRDLVIDFAASKLMNLEELEENIQNKYVQLLSVFTRSYNEMEPYSNISSLLSLISKTIVDSHSAAGFMDSLIECLANLLHSYPNISEIQALPYISKLYRCLVNFLQQGGSKLSVNSLICLCELILNDKLGDKLFNSENTVQTLNLLFGVLSSSKPEMTKRKAIILLKSMTKKQLVINIIQQSEAVSKFLQNIAKLIEGSNKLDSVLLLHTLSILNDLNVEKAMGVLSKDYIMDSALSILLYPFEKQLHRKKMEELILFDDTFSCSVLLSTMYNRKRSSALKDFFIQKKFSVKTTQILNMIVSQLIVSDINRRWWGSHLTCLLHVMAEVDTFIHFQEVASNLDLMSVRGYMLQALHDFTQFKSGVFEPPPSISSTQDSYSLGSYQLLPLFFLHFLMRCCKSFDNFEKKDDKLSEFKKMCVSTIFNQPNVQVYIRAMLCSVLDVSIMLKVIEYITFAAASDIELYKNLAELVCTHNKDLLQYCKEIQLGSCIDLEADSIENNIGQDIDDACDDMECENDTRESLFIKLQEKETELQNLKESFSILEVERNLYNQQLMELQTVHEQKVMHIESQLQWKMRMEQSQIQQIQDLREELESERSRFSKKEDGLLTDLEEEKKMKLKLEKEVEELRRKEENSTTIEVMEKMVKRLGQEKEDLQGKSRYMESINRNIKRENEMISARVAELERTLEDMNSRYDELIMKRENQNVSRSHSADIRKFDSLDEERDHSQRERKLERPRQRPPHKQIDEFEEDMLKPNRPRISISNIKASSRHSRSGGSRQSDAMEMVSPVRPLSKCFNNHQRAFGRDNENTKEGEENDLTQLMGDVSLMF